MKILGTPSPPIKTKLNTVKILFLVPQKRKTPQVLKRVLKSIKKIYISPRNCGLTLTNINKNESETCKFTLQCLFAKKFKPPNCGKTTSHHDFCRIYI
jgi:hypothetical protein